MKNRKTEAIQLRKDGYSYKYIKDKTGLAMSTLSYHLADIPYEPNEETKQTIQNAQLASARTKQIQKTKSINVAKERASTTLGKITDRDLFIAGIALYIGEGSKTNNLVRLVNADADVITLFIRWLLLIGVPKSHIVIRIHAYPETDMALCKNYWMEETGLLSEQFQKPCIDTRVNKDRKRSTTHLYGTAHVTVKANGNPEFGTALSRYIHELMRIVLH